MCIRDSGHVERAICLEEISRHSAGLGIAVMTHHLGMAPILDHGTEEQKKKYLPDLCSGAKICGLSVTEPGGGSDFMGQKATGEFIDGKWVLNGRKMCIRDSHTPVRIVGPMVSQSQLMTTPI